MKSGMISELTGHRMNEMSHQMHPLFPQGRQTRKPGAVCEGAEGTHHRLRLRDEQKENKEISPSEAEKHSPTSSPSCCLPSNDPYHLIATTWCVDHFQRPPISRA